MNAPSRPTSRILRAGLALAVAAYRVTFWVIKVAAFLLVGAAALAWAFAALATVGLYRTVRGRPRGLPPRHERKPA
jgi:hypothetical protein